MSAGTTRQNRLTLEPLGTAKSRFRAAVGGLSPAFWVLWWGVLINRMANFVAVFLAVYLRQQHGFNEAQAGWVVGLWGIGTTVMAPYSGVLTDQVGRRTTMLLGLVLGALSVIAIAFASDPILLTVLSFVGGATQQCFYPASNAAVADLVPPEDRQRAYGLIYWAMNMGLTVGFSIGGMVPSDWLFWLFLADAGTTLVCAGLIAWRVPETKPQGIAPEPIFGGLARVAKDRVYMVFSGLHMLSLVIFTQFQLALPLDMTRHGVSSQGFSWLMAFNCLGVVLLQPWLSPLLKRIDPSRLLALSALLFGIGYAANVFVSTLPMYLLGAAFWTVGEVVGFPSASAMVANLAPRDMRGRYQGVFSMVWGLGMGFSPILGGNLMHRFGAPTLWWSCLGLGTLVAIGHLSAARSRRERITLLEAHSS